MQPLVDSEPAAGTRLCRAKETESWTKKRLGALSVLRTAPIIFPRLNKVAVVGNLEPAADWDLDPFSTDFEGIHAFEEDCPSATRGAENAEPRLFGPNAW